MLCAAINLVSLLMIFTARETRGVDLNSVGFAIVGMFVLVWVGAVAVWKFGRIEEKWSAGMKSGASEVVFTDQS